MELLAQAVAAIGGTPRPNQTAMANAVMKALTTGRHLAVQAGTGTGKSLAYLVPAFAYAQSPAGRDEPVIVSTATVALQRQLVGRDLPRLAAALADELETAPTFAILKGRAHYLCKAKLGSGAEEPLLTDETPPAADTAAPKGEQLVTRLGKDVALLYDWAQETDTGDRDDLPTSVLDLAWRQVSSTAQECVGKKQCPFGEECFAEAARAKAESAQVVVTNHALLAIDALAPFSLLPNHHAVIVDEAHELDQRITSVATAELSASSLEYLARRARRFIREQEVRRLDQFGELLATFGFTLTEETPQGRLEELPQELLAQLATLQELAVTIRRSVAIAEPDEAQQDPVKNAQRRQVATMFAGVIETIERIFSALNIADPESDLPELASDPAEPELFDVLAGAEVESELLTAAADEWFAAEPEPRFTRLADQEDVVWVENGKLLVAPLEISDLLAQTLFAENTVVLTSATLALGGKFEAMARAWGLPKGKYDSLDVGSPFTPQQAGILYTAAHLPEPGASLHPEQLAEMKKLMLAAGGRTLGLFSSKKAAVQAAEALRPQLPFDILLQGDESIAQLVEKYAADPHTCLFGTLTLWQGVDVPGPNSVLVIMDRIPFPRPDDPLLQARKIARDQAGGNGFMEVAATHAALLLAQGAGRLLRQMDDRGVVAILDSRLYKKRYGSFFLKSLPPFWATTDSDVTAQALTRLVAAQRQEKPGRKSKS